MPAMPAVGPGVPATRIKGGPKLEIVVRHVDGRIDQLLPGGLLRAVGPHLGAQSGAPGRIVEGLEAEPVPDAGRGGASGVDRGLRFAELRQHVHAGRSCRCIDQTVHLHMLDGSGERHAPQ